MNELPLLDLARWDSEPRAVAGDVDRWLAQVGFLVVANHGLPPALTLAARRAARRFFALPPTAKHAWACPAEAYRGWVAPGLESNGSSYGEDSGVDQKEAFSVGPVFAGAEALAEQHPRWFAPNLWPDTAVPAFRAAFEAWWHAARTVTDRLLTVLAAALGAPADWLTAQAARPMATITANYYPAADASGGTRVGAHTDFGTLTVLERDADNGLEVLVDGRWLAAPCVPGTLTVNLGEMMVSLSGGRWRANPHRVLARPGAAANLSLIFFHSPDADCPVPDGDGEVSAGTYLGRRMDSIVLGAAPAAGD